MTELKKVKASNGVMMYFKDGKIISKEKYLQLKSRSKKVVSRKSQNKMRGREVVTKQKTKKKVAPDYIEVIACINNSSSFSCKNITILLEKKTVGQLKKLLPVITERQRGHRVRDKITHKYAALFEKYADTSVLYYCLVHCHTPLEVWNEIFIAELIDDLKPKLSALESQYNTGKISKKEYKTAFKQLPVTQRAVNHAFDFQDIS